MNIRSIGLVDEFSEFFRSHKASQVKAAEPVMGSKGDDIVKEHNYMWLSWHEKDTLFGTM